VSVGTKIIAIKIIALGLRSNSKI